MGGDVSHAYIVSKGLKKSKLYIGMSMLFGLILGDHRSLHLELVIEIKATR